MIAPLTLIDYARTRGLDPGEVLAEFTTNPDRLPTPVGEQAGQPTYDPDEVDRARGVTTLAGFARYRGLDVGVVYRWPDLQPVLWPEPVGEARSGRVGAPSLLYPLGGLERVAVAEKARTEGVGVSEDLVTLSEYAGRVGVSVRTVRDTWKERYKDVWPGPVLGEDGRPLKRGRAHLFRFGELEGVRLRVQG